MLLAKSFISASAVAMSIDFIGSRYGWVSSEPQNIISNALIQIMLLFYGWFSPIFSSAESRQINESRA